MKKLIQGIIQFRKNKIKAYQEKFPQLALGQSPETLFITCSDSRIVPQLFTSTGPGDLFMSRNVGNMIAPYSSPETLVEDKSEWAAIEFSILHLKVSEVIICGHSECGAMKAILAGRQNISGEHLKSWLAHGEASISKMESMQWDASISPHNRLSQANVLMQLSHLQTHPLIQEKLEAGELKLYAWWFDIGSGNVYHFDPEAQSFRLIQ